MFLNFVLFYFLNFFLRVSRFAAIYHPITYTVKIRPRKSYAILTIVSVWITSFLIAALPTWLPGFLYGLTAIGLIVAYDVSV